MSRADALVPEGWKPRRGSVVVIEASKDDPAPPHGVWKVLDQAPGTGQWWLQPVSDEARSWAATFPGAVTSGCVVRGGRVLLPKGTRRPRPVDVRDPGKLARR